MAFVLVLLLSITTLVRVETQASSISMRQLEAKQSALLGVMVAVGELQKSVGQDTRVTATAELFDGLDADGAASTIDNIYESSLSPFAGQESWLGVWRSSTVPQPDREYNPALPNDRSFVGWLVSAADASGVAQQLSDIEDVANTVANPKEQVVLAKNGDGTPRLIAGSVNVPRADNGINKYAFAVQDEGVKADVGWHERSPDAVSSEVYQAMRLAASPGPDYGALFSSDESGTFDAGSYPLSPFNRSTGQRAIFNIGSVNSSLPAIEDQDPGFLPNDKIKWLRDQRQHFTAHSVGVMSDVKKGGLRRDLSLAFEMDGEADISFTEQPTKFNQQVGEFVGGDDRMASPYIAKGMPAGVPARYLYRDTNRRFLPVLQQSPFSRKISPRTTSQRTPPVLRGPTWWALRDYANLYKRLKKNGGEFAMDARAYYPNWSAAKNLGNGGYYSLDAFMQHGELSGGQSLKGGAWDQEQMKGEYTFITDHVYMPARATYAPVLLGGGVFISVLVQDQRADPNRPGVVIADLAVGLDPFFYLWNPYNRRLDLDRYGISLPGGGFGGHITLWKNYEDADKEQYGPRTMRDYLIAYDLKGSGNRSNVATLTYLVRDLSLDPGEVLIVSPKSTTTAASRLHDVAEPGINVDNASGIISKWIPERLGSDEGNIRGEIQSVVVAVDTDIAPDVRVDRISYLFSSDEGAFANSENIYNLGNINIRALLPDSDAEPNDLGLDEDRVGKKGNHLQTMGGLVTNDGLDPKFWDAREFYDPDIHLSPAPANAFNRIDWFSANNLNAKRFIGLFTFLAKPTSSTAEKSRPVEIFAQFNPSAPITGLEAQRSTTPNYQIQSISLPAASFSPDQLFQDAKIGFAGENRGFWGRSYDFSGAGLTSVPIKSISSRPLLSLVEFRNANLGHRSGEPFRAVGESFASVFTKRDSPYNLVPGILPKWNWGQVMASDVSWLTNDALFDRYYLSGLAPDFQIGGSGYQANGTLSDTLDKFYGDDYQSANANPLVRPYIPVGSTGAEIVDELAADYGYKRFAAYALIDGVFNVNSTSVPAWEALLRSNRELAVSYAEGDADSASGTPFPPSTEPSSPNEFGREDHWAGLARLDDGQVRELAEAIVDQVKLRGPFMSLSDFVNRRVGEPVDSRTSTNMVGAIQAAIDTVGFNKSVHSEAGGDPPQYTGDFDNFFENDVTDNIDPARRTTTGIAGNLTQGDILLPLAPRLSARSDTFTIRAYGEVRSPTTGDVTRAYCEATVQRLPEYVNHQVGNAGNGDKPWDEAEVTPFAPTGNSNLDAINAAFGRRFTVVDFRWLNSNEI